MNKSGIADIALPRVAAETNKRVILSMGGKGGVGRTRIMVGLAEWFDTNRIPVKLLDLDP
jgi:Mrp family chromosome partitioning ATPase